MMRNTNYLKRYRDITEVLAKENEVTLDEVELIIDQLFFDVKGLMTDPRVPTIKLTNFGTFKPTAGKIQWHINICKDHLARNNGDPSKLLQRISTLEPIRDRLLKEKAGESTWKEWRDKNKVKNEKGKRKKQKVEGESPERHNDSN